MVKEFFANRYEIVVVVRLVDPASSADRSNVAGVAPGADPDDLFRRASAEAGVDWAIHNVMFRGDRIVMNMSPDASKVVIADLLPGLLSAAVKQATVAVPRLQMALHAGERGEGDSLLEFASNMFDAADANGTVWPSGDMVDVIVSDAFYNELTAHDPTVAPALYRRVDVPVRDRSTGIWLRQPAAAGALLAWLDNLPSSNPALYQFLQLFAFLDAAPVGLDWFAETDPLAATMPDLRDALQDSAWLGRTLLEHAAPGLVALDQAAGTVSVHPLLRGRLLDRMPAERRPDVRHTVHGLLTRRRPRDGRDPLAAEHWPRYRELAPHVWSSGLVHSADRESRALVVSTMRYLYYRGTQEEATQLARQAWDAWGGDSRADSQSLDAASDYGLFLWALRRYEAAAEVNRHTLAVRRQVSGERAGATIIARLRHAVDVRTRGDFVAARKLNETIHQEAAELFPEDDPVRLQAAHDLAVVTRLCGDYRQALELNRATWEKRVAVLGENHPDTLNTGSGIPVDLRELGEYADALKRHGEFAEKVSDLVGKKALGALLPQAYLAVTLRKAGEHVRALQLSGRTRKRLTRIHGPDHPVVLACAVGHATDLRLNGELEKAHQVGKLARRGYRETVGKDHPLTWAADANAAVTLRLLGDPAAARRLHERTLRGFRAGLGADHPHAIACAINLASDLAALGDLTAAVRIGADAYDRAMRADRSLGVDHPVTVTAGRNLVLDVRALRADDDARYAEVVDRFRNMDNAEGSAAGPGRANCDIDPLPM